MTAETVPGRREPYPRLENLDRVPEILSAAEVWITEKVHGFNTRFGRDADGTAWLGTRNLVIDPATQPIQGFTQWALSRVGRLAADVTAYGEWAGKGIQKGIDYGDKAFYLFAVRYGTDLQPHGVVALTAELLTCRLAPLVYSGPMPAVVELDEMRKAESLLAPGHTREGIVINPVPTLRDKYGHVVIAKFKAPDFEERSHARREAPAPLGLANVQAFVDEYATDMRLGHVLDQLSERGLDGLDRVNTGALLRAMYEDVTREGNADFEALSGTDQKQVGKVLNVATKRLMDARLLERIA